MGSFEFTVNGKKVDLRKALPLTQGDLEAIEDAGVPLGERLSTKQTNLMLSFVLHKANPDISLDDVRALTAKRAGEVAEAIRTFPEETEARTP